MINDQITLNILREAVFELYDIEFDISKSLHEMGLDGLDIIELTMFLEKKLSIEMLDYEYEELEKYKNFYFFIEMERNNKLEKLGIY